MRRSAPLILLLPLLASCGIDLLADDDSAQVTESASTEAPPVTPADPYVDERRGDTLGEAVALFERGRLDDTRDKLVRLLRPYPSAPEVAEPAVSPFLSDEERLSAEFLLGWVEQELGHPGRAALRFDAVRVATDHPLRELAAWQYASAQLAAGDAPAAAVACSEYLGSWPDGPWADGCRLARARARVEMRQFDRATAELATYVRLQDDEQKAEQVKLELADAQVRSGQMKEAVRLYKDLYLEHSMAMTGALAEDALRRLAPSTLADLSDDELYRRAVTLQGGDRSDESHALYQDLLRRAAAKGSSGLSNKLSAEEHQFLWRNRRYEEVAASHAARHKANHAGSKGAEHAYWAVQGYSRSGKWDEAIEMQLHGMQAHGASRRFRGSEERLALLYLGAGRYQEAREAFGLWQKRSRRAANDGRVAFNIAYTAYRAGDLEAARKGLEELAADGGHGEKRARYYLGKVLGLQGDAAGRDREWDRLLREHGGSWYAQVIRSRRRDAAADDEGPAPRVGSWPAPPEQTARLVVLEPDRPTAPPVWLNSRFWSRDDAFAAWTGFVDELAPGWPELRAARELSRLGLDELSGPIARSVYEDIIDHRKHRTRSRNKARAWERAGSPEDDLDGARAALALDTQLSAKEWTMVLSGAGVPSLVSAFSDDWIDYDGLDRADPEDRRAWSLRYPAAFGAEVWDVARRYGVDPLLLLAIMRAESFFKHDAVSPVGARGLIQVMPSTGARVASLAGFEDFRVEKLTEPETNLRVGAWYMGRLLQRFGPGYFPLAVGSYNGGPHNIGRWLQPKVGMDLEDFVEEIPFDETRRYVKKVTRYYAVYADLYGGGAPVAIPASTSPDDPEVIDF